MRRTETVRIFRHSVGNHAAPYTVATGRQTEIGRIAQALATGQTAPPPLIRRLERFSRHLGVITMVLIAAIAIAQLLQGTPLVTVFLVAIVAGYTSNALLT